MSDAKLAVPGPRSEELLKVREQYLPRGLADAVPTFAAELIDRAPVKRAYLRR